MPGTSNRIYVRQEAEELLRTGEIDVYTEFHLQELTLIAERTSRFYHQINLIGKIVLYTGSEYQTTMCLDTIGKFKEILEAFTVFLI